MFNEVLYLVPVVTADDVGDGGHDEVRENMCVEQRQQIHDDYWMPSNTGCERTTVLSDCFACCSG